MTVRIEDRKRPNHFSNAHVGIRFVRNTGGMTVTRARRWERRLEELVALPRDAEAEAPLDAWTVTTARRILYRLDELGADTSPLRLFLGDDGSLEIRLRRGWTSRSLEIAENTLTLWDVDVPARTSIERHVPDINSAAEALARA